MIAEKCCEIIDGSATGRIILCCDHASNAVPESINGGDLGLPQGDMERHIAYDIGAAGLTRALAQRLSAPAVLSLWSRLVIDLNRAERDPTLIRQIYDGTVIPGNSTLDDTERNRRILAWYRPYHGVLAQMMAREGAILVAIHSFTPQLVGRAKRPWHVGVLHSPKDPSLSLALIARLRAESDLVIGDNEPYSGHLPGDTVDQHALTHGRPNTLIEVRNDLIATPEGQDRMADLLLPRLLAAVRDLVG